MVPITTFEVFFNMFPTLNSVVKEVLLPKTVLLAVLAVIVPVLPVLGHAVALQFPVPAEVTAAEKLKLD